MGVTVDEFELGFLEWKIERPLIEDWGGWGIGWEEGSPRKEGGRRQSRNRVSVRKRNLHLYQRLLHHKDCKSRDVHEWQKPERESQQANPHDRLPQYFSENLFHMKIEPALPEDFSPRHLKSYQLVYAPRS
ncbi:Uncharacterized protein Fot_53054 [Forsythia ovata]|uniref:Uncharacterized protein n=1 Tax=Forsythia ovata TaxID=205694 RepID=A0ABD1PHK3_9LAMI